MRIIPKTKTSNTGGIYPAIRRTKETKMREELDEYHLLECYITINEKIVWQGTVWSSKGELLFI
jgi:transposase-like protein